MLSLAIKGDPKFKSKIDIFFPLDLVTSQLSIEQFLCSPMPLKTVYFSQISHINMCIKEMGKTFKLKNKRC